MRIPDPLWIKSPDDTVKVARKIACMYATETELCDPPVSLSIIRYGKAGFAEPRWIADLVDEDDKARARLRFFVRVAALYASPKGTLTALSLAAGLNPRVLSTYTCAAAGRKQVAARVAKRIEKACGGVVTRAALCPDAFGEGDDK